eukprot:gb/GECG01002071.1/.p1 GENE.gb/GECG01002071.1/~~gb/GECG01002071.1/.p1  ORF type:complete len:124 (+),score=7.40 gb/GECG01002071.1/:1-372(+)
MAGGRKSLGHLCIGVSCILLLHTLFSSLHYQHLVDELYGVHDVPLPRDVWIETCLFLIFGIVGLVLFVGSFKPAVKRARDVPERSWDTHQFRPNFVPIANIDGREAEEPVMTSAGNSDMQDLD